MSAMPPFKPVVLWTDWVMFALLLALVLYGVHVRRSANLRADWTRVLADAPALCSAIVLALFLLVTMLDSVHFRRALPGVASGPATAVAFDARTESLLDLLLARQVYGREASYSKPLDWQEFTRQSVTVDGQVTRSHARLKFGGAHLADPGRQWVGDLMARGAAGLAMGLVVAAVIAAATAWLLDRAGRRGDGHRPARAATSGSGRDSFEPAGGAREPRGLRQALRRIAANDTRLPLRAALITATVVCLLAGLTVAWAAEYHVLGTDRTGNDVLLQALKSVRTAFVIGTLATVATLPFAVVLGVMAGYFKGWVDEVIQYLYTTLSSVPNVLLIAACVLMLQVFLDQHADLFETGAERADLRIFLLCLVLGVTGWAGLCRLLRAETLKLRELEFVQAATAFGVGHWRIMARHVAPNLMHLVLITTVLEFSGLILYEAVLSYVGVGVDPSMNSFGGMINLARSEMSRDPLVWWSFAAAFAFMVTLVLAANLFADGVRHAFDPRARSFRPRRRVAAPVAASGSGSATGGTARGSGRSKPNADDAKDDHAAP
jgi:peptide/nickel transport system permease protein